MKGGTIRRTEGRSTWGWTPHEHVLTALQLLGELENELRGGGSIAAGQYYPICLLTATRRQLWLAVVALDSRRSSASWWPGPTRIARKRGWAATILLGAIAWGAFGSALPSAGAGGIRGRCCAGSREADGLTRRRESSCYSSASAPEARAGDARQC